MANPAAKPPASPAPIPASPAAAVAPIARKFNPLYVILPLLVMVVVGVGVGWEMFRAKMEAAQQGQGGEDSLAVDPRLGSLNERKSRELKPSPAPEPVPESQADELTGLGKKKPPAAAPPKTYTPVERAWRAVKADFDKLEARNETTAKKYRIRILAMGDRKGVLPEASFVAEARALEDTLKQELAKPENQ